MLNPAGAPGYGQKFADLHIDDWGYPAGSDIIEGVTKFVEAHPFVDGDRIGNFGRSYGGFMTMHLLTRTDLFAASVEVAGISNIAGYWGAGWTGFSYTDGTCPGCYPWNRRDVYVDRSPLFQADRIRTPLLLIHGTRDTNVVPTESEQMFTALRGLGMCGRHHLRAWELGIGQHLVERDLGKVRKEQEQAAHLRSERALGGRPSSSGSTARTTGSTRGPRYSAPATRSSWSGSTSICATSRRHGKLAGKPMTVWNDRASYVS